MKAKVESHGKQPEEASTMVGKREDNLRAPRRRGAHRVDPKVLEARLAQRYETFALPVAFTAVFRYPEDVMDRLKLELLGKT